MWYLKIIFFVITYSNKFAPKTNNFYGQFRRRVFEDIEDIEDICPSSQSGTFLKRVEGHWRCLSFIPVCDIEKENCLLQRSLWNWQYHILIKYGTSIFNCNDFYDLERNTECLTSCLVCYQLHWKLHEFSIFWTYFWASIALECYHFYFECSYD